MFAPVGWDCVAVTSRGWDVLMRYSFDGKASRSIRSWGGSSRPAGGVAPSGAVGDGSLDLVWWVPNLGGRYVLAWSISEFP
jgi:hypothetical protein